MPARERDPWAEVLSGPEVVEELRKVNAHLAGHGEHLEAQGTDLRTIKLHAATSADQLRAIDGKLDGIGLKLDEGFTALAGVLNEIRETLREVRDAVRS